MIEKKYARIHVLVHPLEWRLRFQIRRPSSDGNTLIVGTFDAIEDARSYLVEQGFTEIYAPYYDAHAREAIATGRIK